jgi:Rieske Fe-S protein
MIIQSVFCNLPINLFLSADYSAHEGSCIKHQIHELTKIHEQFNGFPKSYCLENTKIHQLWWKSDQIDFDHIGRQLNMEVITVSSICQPPGCVVPWHNDTFYQINQRFPDRKETKVRANIFLEDWKMGHFIQYGDEVSTHWKAGQGWLWDSDVLHLGANAGLENKYTLQISGFLIE